MKSVEFGRQNSDESIELRSEQLPVGWIEATLGDIAEWSSGGTPKATEPKFYNGDVPWLIIADLNNSTVISSAKKITQLGLENSSAKWVEIGSVMIAMYGSIGKLGIAGIRCTTNQAIAFTKKIWGTIPNRYIFYYLQYNEPNLLNLGQGGAQKNINQNILKEYSFLLAPLNEQKRIVAKLAAIMPRIEAVKERLNKIPAILKRFRQSVLTAAVTGKLTEQWRKTHPNVENWEEVRLIDVIVEKPRNGYSPTAVKYETSVKSLTLTATTSGKFDGTCFKFIDEVIPKDSHLWLRKDDILIQRSNSIQYVGISAIYTGNDFAYIYPDLMMKIKANKEIADPYFLLLALQSSQTLDFFRNNATGTAGSMPKINQTTVMNAPIPHPPLEEQKEIVRQVEKLFTLGDKVEAHYRKARARVDKLSQAVLAKAFRGELVPQDPNDEPAEKLLERIQQEKARMETKIKATKKRGSKK